MIIRLEGPDVDIDAEGNRALPSLTQQFKQQSTV